MSLEHGLPEQLEAPVGKTVGRRRPPEALEDSARDCKRDAEAWSRAMDTPFVPRGVYRFRTHEEADAWLWAMITRVKGNH